MMESTRYSFEPWIESQMRDRDSAVSFPSFNAASTLSVAEGERLAMVVRE